MVTIRGIVQGVGFRPFVYAQAVRLAIDGSVMNRGGEVVIIAAGDHLDDFVRAVSLGPPLARIDSITTNPYTGDIPEGTFLILPSGEGARTGMIPPDIATCPACLADIDDPNGRYRGYWATSCVNCGPRYSIINSLPYDRERTSMAGFPPCTACRAEYGDPGNRRHHAQTIACQACGPVLVLLDQAGTPVTVADPAREAARLLDTGSILAIRGIGGFHIACIEERAEDLKQRLGRTWQPFATMVRPDYLTGIARVTPRDRETLEGPERPIVVMEKRDPSALSSISPLHTIGCMLPYTGFHHILFSALAHPLLVMTSANMPGYPMITGTEEAVRGLSGIVDGYLTHTRPIVNRCDDSVVRDGLIIRLSRGLAPRRTRIDLGDACILGVGPELNSNTTLYRDGFAVTSPHVGNVRNPKTYGYLTETIGRLRDLLQAEPGIIAHDLHPQFLSTHYARELASETGAELVPVQHHRAHIAAATQEPCVGIAIDGVGYGDDGTVWGGEIFAGQAPHLRRAGHLEVVPMPGGDLAARFPERMLYGILPVPEVLELFRSRGWDRTESGVLATQVERGIRVARTSSTGRVLDAASALLGICRERTYDGEPAMRLESVAAQGTPEPWEYRVERVGGLAVLSTRHLLKVLLDRYLRADSGGSAQLPDLAASFQDVLARGIAEMAAWTAEDEDYQLVALSGGVAYNRAIRETIRRELASRGLTLLINTDYPLGDGCISFGQCITAGLL